LINAGAEIVWFSLFGQDARILPEIRLHIIRSYDMAFDQVSY